MDIDLHCHSTASDGVLTPDSLVLRAYEKGVKVLALTDHDTVEGLALARDTANKLGIQLINGIEFSATHLGATVHILGYDFRLNDPAILSACERLKQARWSRAIEIAERLAKKGMGNALEGAIAVQAERGESENAPARPHFAQFLVNQGYVKDFSEAFRKWLGAGKVGDVKQHWPCMEQVLETLHQANAWISLAHPYQYNFTRTKRRRLVSDFAALGGHALEVSNGMQPAEEVGVLSILAREFQLMGSAGSDFHLPKPWSELGVYRPFANDLPALWQNFQC
ncbi:PHP domain-containing protein [Pseudomonas sp. F1_0610]|uniref:PHP domain-containing protein n=1 Tax=Pseudomonas sp. F1_0610 TaxID=3114284 RepID=UPI0039C3EA4E